MQPTTKGAHRLLGFNKPTVWTVMTPLAIKTKSVNLGQGFPSWGPPDFYKKYLEESIKESNPLLIQATISTSELMDPSLTQKQLLNSTSQLSDTSTMNIRFASSVEVSKDFSVLFSDWSILEKKLLPLTHPTTAIVPKFRWQEAKPLEFHLFLEKAYFCSNLAN